MAAKCVRCGRPTDAYVCRPEAQALAAELATAAGHAEDAEAVLTGQVRYGGGSRGGNEDPMPNLAASVRLGRINTAVRFWTEDLRDGEPLPSWRRAAGPPCQDGARCPHASCAALRVVNPPSALAQGFAWLSGQMEALRQHPAADEAYGDLKRACEELARLIDRPPGKRLVGVCDCGRILYAADGWSVIRCPKPCGAIWNVGDGQDILMRHLDDRLVTGSEAAKLAAYLDADRTQDNIRKLIDALARRSQFIAHGYVMRDPTDAELRDDPAAGPVAVPTYRFGDIREQLARTPRRNREGAAA